MYSHCISYVCPYTISTCYQWKPIIFTWVVCSLSIYNHYMLSVETNHVYLGSLLFVHIQSLHVISGNQSCLPGKSVLCPYTITTCYQWKQIMFTWVVCSLSIYNRYMLSVETNHIYLLGSPFFVHIQFSIYFP